MSSESFERSASAPVLLVGVDFGVPHFDDELEELGLLAQTAGLQPVARLTCKRKAPDPALFVGSGKADEIRMLAQMHGAKEVWFDQALSPAQQRNLERHIQMPVNDRTMLILEIFAQRARSHEGKLQVELARLQYISTRLVRRWSHLERQAGGIGGRGGPGEKQIELDRRMIDDAIKRTKERLKKVKKQRSTQRRQRSRREVFNISLVGYTNAGKSTLFNAMVKARAYAADQLFATLDTTTRQMYLAEAEESVSLSDTVGFIRDLPHGLVDAFQATLQEAIDADLLLHVVDASNPGFPEQIQQVQKVLGEIGADDVPQILVFNKLDAIEPERQPAMLQDMYELDGTPVPRVFVSARSGQGLAQLRQMLADRVLQVREEAAREEVEGQDDTYWMSPDDDAQY
ncbi:MULTISPECIES: GTPase HflX [Comamonas]|uniref:GTPase HflX n=1 Tax=Comamonas sp. F1-6 TaxID=673550 RepID=UPI00050EEA3B|nr:MULTISPECIES: GTPase HflX [Comamonas]KGG83974.1 GTP-binding protein HflX [Comamonas thiooxydans]KGG88687.1 GTP-binding protein HflX [Comamonas thiooxydans]KGG94185.1 GTP-binding protein HflX [Comamonas thiooxydans]KGH04821.1 GTP-binding protein HflX [Comamonas thiooxydans]MCO8251305.1 GTPase HflX [Comamonas thiooxydans]